MQINRSNLPPLSCLLPFEAAARLNSITQAALELNLTQAAVSKQIKALEGYLGAQVFERRNRAVHLTAEGRELQQIVRGALGEIAGACHTIREAQATPELVLRSQQCEAIYWLMPRLSRFYQAHPGVELRVSVSTTPLSEATDRFDIALQTVGRALGNADLVYEAEDEVFPVCSPSYLLCAPGQLSLDALTQCRLLHHYTDRQDWTTWPTWFEKIGPGPRNAGSDLTFDSYPMVMQAAIEGHGIALGWWRTCEHLLHTGALVRPCPNSLAVPDRLGVYVPKGKPRKPQFDALMDWLVAELS